VSLYPTTKGSTRGLDTDTTSPGILLPATLDSSCSTYLTAPGWPSCVRIAGCRARAHTRVDRLGGLGTVMCPPLRVHGLTARRQSVCPAVGLGRSTARRAAGLGSPVCVAAGGVGRPTRMGPTTRPQIRTAGSAEPHTGSRPSASSPGPATEFDLPTRAGRPRHVPPKPGTPDHGPAPADGARTTTATKG
jgi:hypothetical protein